MTLKYIEELKKFYNTLYSLNNLITNLHEHQYQSSIDRRTAEAVRMMFFKVQELNGIADHAMTFIDPLTRKDLDEDHD